MAADCLRAAARDWARFRARACRSMAFAIDFTSRIVCSLTSFIVQPSARAVSATHEADAAT